MVIVLNFVYFNPVNHRIFHDTYLFIWDVAQFLIYLILFLRLYHAFYGTQYAISSKIHAIFVILAIIYILVIIAGIVKIAIFVFNYEQKKPFNRRDYQLRYDTGAAYIIGFEVVDLCISVALITLFINKLLIVAVDLRLNQPESSINDEALRLVQHQKLLSDITAKYFILSVTATSWTQIAALLTAICYFGEDYISENTLLILYNSSIIFWYIDGIINPICLFLIFEVNDVWYQKLCRGCHAFSKLCFKKYTKKSVRKKYGNGGKDDSMKLSLIQNM